jgi:sulfite reductase (NADPH) hemoprotein beta-component
MYLYDEIDRAIVSDRVAQFKDQLARFLKGDLSEDEFRPLRLQNGLYLQRHAPMLRVAIPYGMLRANQLRKLAEIARRFDRGYAHFTTRQNIQFNWPKLEDCGDILAELAKVEMHAIQTSGNCIRNTTTDHFAGVAADEVADPRPTCELIRQWSTFHPEFAYLPRKFKIAVNGALNDRAAVLAHDIGVLLTRNEQGEPCYSIYAGGGLGRTPVIGHLIRERLPRAELLNYLSAILRVYNRFGRRDNLYKARIKILVRDLTPDVFARHVEDEWSHLAGGPGTVPDAEFARLASFFEDPPYAECANEESLLARQAATSKPFSNWLKRNVTAHRVRGYAAVTLSLKKTGSPPGDASADQLDAIAALSEAFSFGEARVSHEQNLILADVRQDALFALFEALRPLGLATPNIGLVTDIVCCPGGDFCALANAKSIPVAEAIQRRIDERIDAIDFMHDIGDIDVNISGCINACGHHHIGHIGILGVDKNGEEWYQVTIGGSQGNAASIGKIIGPSFARAQMPDVIERLLQVYVRERHGDERFIDTVHRVGIEPFKNHVYKEPEHA